MIRINDSSIIIEITSGSPLANLATYQTAIITALQNISPEDIDRDTIKQTVSGLASLLGNMLLSPDQMADLDLLLSCDTCGNELKKILYKNA